MQTRVWNGELYMQLRDGRFVPYLERIEARRWDPLEELRWREVCRRMDANRPGVREPGWKHRPE